MGFQRLEREFLAAQRQIDSTLSELHDERNMLEEKVNERTIKLRRVNEIGRTVTSILDPDELLARASYLIGMSSNVTTQRSSFWTSPVNGRTLKPLVTQERFYARTGTG
ncbi:MAG: hypothetical protein IPN58_16050 [Anaerolineales bacterium]|nr:hypothetical protein [Anaerolineales bacterium]